MDKKEQSEQNRETWLVKVWIDNDQGMYLYWRDRTAQFLRSEPSDQARKQLADALEEWFEDLAPEIPASAFSDLMTTATSRIDWYSIADELIVDSPKQKPEPVLIFAYTRKQAIEDGTLVDVSDLAKEAGFKFPVAITAAAWTAAVEVPFNAPGQDETGRLWDVLNVLRFSIIGRDESEIRFCVSVVGSGGTSRRVDLKSICGPGDNAEPVITIMLPRED
ncbi:DUF6573 family protein [Planctomicrobium sp. SH664]|uniref:DUF6573 family protein n=1 Tax=Planctomicrobium sp. SH664 TaxID=3448125 RepID=UPI003F5BBD5A